MKLLILLPVIFALLFFIPTAFAQESQTLPTEQGTLDVKLTYDAIDPGILNKIGIEFINPQTQKIQAHIDYTISVSKDGERVFGPIPLTHTSVGNVKIPIEFNLGEGTYSMDIEVEGILFNPIPPETVSFDISVSAAGNKITTTINKSIYEDGDRIYITGKVPQFLQGEKLIWRIFSPNENVVALGTDSVGTDKKFIITKFVGGTQWKLNGEYIIELHYGKFLNTITINYITNEQSITKSESNSKCDAGTIFDFDTKSCIFNTTGYLGNVGTSQSCLSCVLDDQKSDDTSNSNEIIKLKLEIEKLKKQNKVLQNIISEQLRIIMNSLDQFK